MVRVASVVLLASVLSTGIQPRVDAASAQAPGAPPGAQAGTTRPPEAAPAPAVAPASLPSGAELPPALPSRKVRADVFFARVQSLANAVNCPSCQGTGTEVKRVREKSGHLAAPAKVHEVREPCEDCKGSGCRHDPERLASAIDGVVEALVALDDGSKVPQKQVERSRQLLLRVASDPELAESVAAGDRNAVGAGRTIVTGSPVTLVGMVGKPIPMPGGGRLVPVGTGAQSAVLLRELALNDLPAAGSGVLVGGCVAGPVDKVEWEWGKVLVLDHGFVVPLKPPPAPAGGVAAPAAPAQQAAPRAPASSAVSSIP